MVAARVAVVQAESRRLCVATGEASLQPRRRLAAGRPARGVRACASAGPWRDRPAGWSNPPGEKEYSPSTAAARPAPETSRENGIANVPVGFDRSRRCGGTRSNALNLGGGGLDNVGGRGFDQ
jgi:hypothetical protein